MDPDPSEPNAQQVAETRAIGAMLGLMAPPVGWDCYLTTPLADQGLYFQDMACEPDPAAIAEQEPERQRWLDELARRAERIGRRLGLGRSR